MGTHPANRPALTRCTPGLRGHRAGSTLGITRRGFLGTLSGTAAFGGLAWGGVSRVSAGKAGTSGTTGLPVGAPLRVKPALVHRLYQRK